MQDLDPFVIHFSRLVWLLANRPHEQDGQKEELRRSLMHLSSQPQVVQLRELTLAVAEAPDAGAETMAGLKELAVRMSGHSVRMLEFEAAAPVRDVFQIAQALASNPSYGDDGAAFDEKV